jgi:hypothetical protein
MAGAEGCRVGPATGRSEWRTTLPPGLPRAEVASTGGLRFTGVFDTSCFVRSALAGSAFSSTLFPSNSTEPVHRLLDARSCTPILPLIPGAWIGRTCN